jgi:dihydroneopterin aldolase/2-amino-4-hydroxy-6-hydroxymethyldihydropteridine diphosphokinase
MRDSSDLCVIKIKDLAVYANHGVNPEEKVLGQRFLATLEIFFDASFAARTDDLEKTINYAETVRQVKKIMRERSFNLIEAAADNLARQILLNEKLARGVTVTIKKPMAPIDASFDYISATVTKRWNQFFLGIGSNLGGREKNIADALEFLAADDLIIKKVSRLIETEPIGVSGQPRYLNGAAQIKTLLSPRELLRKIHAVEKKLGRERNVRWEPRTIDVDILLWDGPDACEPNLVIPHPEICRRPFIVESLMELDSHVAARFNHGANFPLRR